MTFSEIVVLYVMSVAGVAHPVERHLAKVEVASSSLVTRSIKEGSHFMVVFLLWIGQKSLERLEKSEKTLDKTEKYDIIIKNLALWCSRLARQPVTLEVDGSSPFGVAKKKTLFPKGKGVFLFEDTERTDSNHLNPTCRWHVGRCRLDDSASLL